MKEVDIFARIITDHGPPRKIQKVPANVANEFQHRVPAELISFWLAHGWGEYKEGYFRVCDPRPFDPLLETIFKSDPEFLVQDFTVVGYTLFNTLRIWDRAGRTVLVHLEDAEVFGPPFSSIINPDTGNSYSQAFLAGLLIFDELSLEIQDFYKEACIKIGPPASGEVFGYAPALQLGGEQSLSHIRRFQVIEYMTFLAQLARLTVTELTAPQPDAPLGRMRKVRKLGR